MVNFVPKKFLLFLLLIIFLFQANAVFAFEIKYPKIPGVLAPQEIQQKIQSNEIAPNQEASLYVKYYLNLSFVVILLICLGVFAYGGALYLFSGTNPALMETAKQWIGSALIGLAIIVSSWAVLYTINPQLLTLKPPPAPPKFQATAESPAPSKIIYYKTSLSLVDKILENLGKTHNISLEEVSRMGDKLATSTITAETQNSLALLWRAKTAIKKVKILTGIIKDLLAECRCGDSLFHAKFDLNWGGGKCYCLPGEQSGDKVKFCENVCLEGETGCDLGGATCDIGKIKKRRDELADVLAELYAIRGELITNQVGPNGIAGALDIAKSQYEINSALGGEFGLNFDQTKKNLEDKGKNVEVIGLEKPSLEKPSDPLSYYFPIQAGANIIPKPDISENKKVIETSQAFSLTLLLSKITPQKFKEMIGSCVQLAFGNADFKLDENIIKELMDEAIRSGASKYIISVFLDQIDKLSKLSADKTQNKVEEDMEQCGFSQPISKILSGLALKSIREQLPGKLNKFFKETPESAFFSDKLQNLLSAKIGDMSFLNTSFEDLPGVKENLQKEVTTLFSASNQKIINKVDKFLKDGLKNGKAYLENWFRAQVANFFAQITGALIGKSPGDYTTKEDCEDANFIWDDGVCRKKEAATDFYGDSEKCKKAGYWYDFSSGACYEPAPNMIHQPDECAKHNYYWDYKLNKCSAEPGKGLQGSLVSLRLDSAGVKRWVNLLMDQFISGLSAFPSAFVTAIGQISSVVISSYVIVVVEDEVLSRIEPYLAQVQELFGNARKLLHAKIEDLLPKEFSDMLKTNISEFIAKKCKDDTKGDNPSLQPCPKSPEAISQAIKDEGGIDKYTNKYSIACCLDDFLKISIENLFPDAVQNFLKSPIEDAFGPEFNNFLSSSPSELAFPGIPADNIEKIINLSPKAIFCGDFPFPSPSDTTLMDQCAEMATTSQFFALFPFPTPDAAKISAKPAELQDFYTMYCGFRPFFCRAPLDTYLKPIDQPLGTFIVAFIKKSLEIMKDSGNSDLQKAQPVLTKIDTSSLAESVFYYALETIFGETAPLEKKEEEINSLEWLLSSFPELSESVHNVATARGISEADWLNIVSIVGNAKNPTELPQNIQDGAILVSSWFVSGKTIGYVLKNTPLNAMRFLKGKSYSGRNILGQTPVELLDAICYKINKVNASTTLMDSFPKEYKNYLLGLKGSCANLKKTPADILKGRGIDLGKKFISYLPPAYGETLTAFQGVMDGLDEKDKPVLLGDLINFIAKETPLSFLEQTGKFLKKREEVKETKVKDALESIYPTVLEIIFESQKLEDKAETASVLRNIYTQLTAIKDNTDSALAEVKDVKTNQRKIAKLKIIKKFKGRATTTKATGAKIKLLFNRVATLATTTWGSIDWSDGSIDPNKIKMEAITKDELRAMEDKIKSEEGIPQIDEEISTLNDSIGALKIEIDAKIADINTEKGAVTAYLNDLKEGQKAPFSNWGLSGLETEINNIENANSNITLKIGLRGKYLIGAADFLKNGTIYNYIKNIPGANKEIIDIIFESLGIKNWLDMQLGWEGWQTIQNILGKTPNELIEEYLPGQILNANQKKALSQSPIDTLAVQFPWFGNPLIDLLGLLPNWTCEEGHEGEFEKMGDAVNKWTGDILDGVETGFKKMFDALVFEVPKAIGGAIIDGITGKKADKINDQLAGTGCEEVDKKENCLSPKIFTKGENGEANQCCDIGKGLICDAVSAPSAEDNKKCRLGTYFAENETGKKCCYTVLNCVVDKINTALGPALQNIMENGPWFLPSLEEGVYPF